MIIWITGMSGSGKTTLGSEIVRLLKNKEKSVVFVDGDNFRQYFSAQLGYSLEDRKENLRRIRDLCRFLDSQSIDAVCSVLSLFPGTEEENRNDFRNYYEISLEVPFDLLLKERDYKGLYHKAIAGETSNVVGVDLPFYSPKKPDLVIQNTSSKGDFLHHAETIVSRLFPSGLLVKTEWLHKPVAI